MLEGLYYTCFALSPSHWVHATWIATDGIGIGSEYPCSATVGFIHKRVISGKLKNNVDFHCTSCFVGCDQSVLLREDEIEPNVMLKCVSEGYG